MASSSFTRRAKLVNGRFERKYRTSTGELRTEILEDSSVGGVSTAATVSGELVSDDISTQIVSEKIAYTVTNNFVRNSILVFLSGVNVTSDITVTGNNSFTFTSDYSNNISTEDNLLVYYVKSS